MMLLWLILARSTTKRYNNWVMTERMHEEPAVEIPDPTTDPKNLEKLYDLKADKLSPEKFKLALKYHLDIIAEYVTRPLEEEIKRTENYAETRYFAGDEGNSKREALGTTISLVGFALDELRAFCEAKSELVSITKLQEHVEDFTHDRIIPAYEALKDKDNISDEEVKSLHNALIEWFTELQSDLLRDINEQQPD